MEMFSPKNRKDVKALIRVLGLELVSIERIPDDDSDDPGNEAGVVLLFSGI